MGDPSSVRGRTLIMKKKAIWIGSAVILVAVIVSMFRDDSSVNGEDLATYAVQRGDLVIDVLEGGNIQALAAMEIKNEVKESQGTKVLSIIDEGYQVTEEDVKNRKVLVRLDPTGLETKIVDQELEFQETQAEFAEAKQALEIEESEAQSAIKLGRQAVRFSLLDFQKFVGETAAVDILKSLELPYDKETIEFFEDQATKTILASFDAQRLVEEETQKSTDDSQIPFDGSVKESRSSEIDFDEFLTRKHVGNGEADQTIRRLRDEALVAETELAVVEESVEGAKRLHEKEFITRTTLDNEMVNLEKAKLSLQTKKIELELFQDYEFPKEGEKMLSLYEEALLELVRDKRDAIASVSQYKSRFLTRKRRYELEIEKRADLEEQLKSCTIYASQVGLVAYGGANDNYYTSRYYEAISEGATLKLGQPIITIPDMSQLGVDVDIHESHVKKIERGQRAIITADAVPDKVLDGEVLKVAVLPDSNASRYNPSLKVYPATISIAGNNDFLKPGMTAKVEIIVNELQDVLYIPVQAVFVEEDKHIAFIKDGGRYDRVEIEVGQHNDEFIEVRSGLEETDMVALSAPSDYDPTAAAAAAALASN